MTLTNDRPVFSSEKAPHMKRTEIFKEKEISGDEPQTGVDINTDRLTDRQSQFDFSLLVTNCLKIFKASVDMNEGKHEAHDECEEKSNFWECRMLYSEI
jgi:hypothetical protein